MIIHPPQVDALFLRPPSTEAGQDVLTWLLENPLRRWRLVQVPILGRNQVADKLFAFRGTIGGWERGLHEPSASRWVDLTKLTGITPAEWQEWLDRRPHE